MEALLAAIEATAPAVYLRVSRLGYAAVSGAHVLGIALLIGAVLPLDLRLLGFWPKTSRESLFRILVPMAVIGLLIAAPTGLLLFSVRAQEYALVPYFQAKLALIAIGIVGALLIHHSHGLTLEGASRTRLRLHAIASMTCWLGALACGRMIAFVVD